ncbi:MAG TPA: DUF2442 domain-containing protein [Planctomycetota bacterium]|jgi:hypothetical protein|nr:DUF2442 domain-containing protein [Planctomycetota bacterium]
MMKRIREATPLPGYRLRLTLTDGTVIVRAIRPLMVGPVFGPLRRNPDRFADVRVEGGTVVWPNGADLCPDVLIWGGPPPARTRRRRHRAHATPSGARRRTPARTSYRNSGRD